MFGNLFSNPLKKSEEIKKEMKPIYVKKDGTKVYETKNEFGTMVWQMNSDGVFIMHGYNDEEKIICDLVRKFNFEVGHEFNELEKVSHEFTNLYDEKNEKLIKKIDIYFNYHSNGKISSKIEINETTQVKTIINFNENEEQIEKIIERGTVKTYYDKDDKPYKREIDKGSGGIITEEL